MRMQVPVKIVSEQALFMIKGLNTSCTVLQYNEGQYTRPHAHAHTSRIGTSYSDAVQNAMHLCTGTAHAANTMLPTVSCPQTHIKGSSAEPATSTILLSLTDRPDGGTMLARVPAACAWLHE